MLIPAIIAIRLPSRRNGVVTELRGVSLVSLGFRVMSTRARESCCLQVINPVKGFNYVLPENLRS